MNQHLTDTIVRRLPIPTKASKIYYDSDVAGFGCCVTATGMRSFILNYRTRSGRERRLTIGSAKEWGVTAARNQAKELKRQIARGDDP
jgi:hypothetical protein